MIMISLTQTGFGLQRGMSLSTTALLLSPSSDTQIPGFTWSLTQMMIRLFMLTGKSALSMRNISLIKMSPAASGR